MIDFIEFYNHSCVIDAKSDSNLNEQKPEPKAETYFRLIQDQSATDEEKKKTRQEVFDSLDVEPEMFISLNEKIEIPKEIYPHNFTFLLKSHPDDGDISLNVADSSGEFIKYYMEHELTKKRLRDIVTEANSLTAMASIAMHDVMTNELSSEESKAFVAEFKKMGESAVGNAGLLGARKSMETGEEIDNLMKEEVFIPNGIMELLTFKFGYGLVNLNFYQVDNVEKGFWEETNESWVMVNSNEEFLKKVKPNLKEVLRKLRMTESLMRYFDCNEPARYYLDYQKNIYMCYYSNENSRIDEFINHYESRMTFNPSW